MSTSSATTPTYVVIDADPLATNANKILFKNALQPPKNGGKTLKVGARLSIDLTALRTPWPMHSRRRLPARRISRLASRRRPTRITAKTGPASTRCCLSPAPRYVPPDKANPTEYVGVLQIQTYGKLFEALLHAYLAPAVEQSRVAARKCEWFKGARTKLDALVAAIEAAGATKADTGPLQRETPRPFTNVTPFVHAYTLRAGKGVDDLLTLFRVRYRGVEYQLTEVNVEAPLRLIAKQAPSLAASVVVDSESDDADDESSTESE